MGGLTIQYAKLPETKRNSPLLIQRKKSSQPIKSSANRILFLQRTIGNQAVQRLIKSGTLQAKLRIGQPEDKYEQEADRVAEAVMRMPEPGVQRQVEPEEEEEETLQPKPLASQITPLVQVQHQEELEEKEEELLQTKPLAEEITPLVQKQIEPEEEEEEVQAKATSGHISEANPNLESKIHSLRGGGQPLSNNDRTFFEPRFGRDFSQVRVLTDTRASEAARAVNARAFTMGQDVVFGAGHYASGTSEGQKLMAHELTHVVQQGKFTADNVSDQQPVRYRNKAIRTRCQPRIQLTTLCMQDVLWQTGLYPCSTLAGRAVAEFNSQGARCQSYQARGGTSYGATPAEAVIWPDAASSCSPGSCGCVRRNDPSGSINIPANFCSSSCAFWLRPGDSSSASVSDALCVLAHELSHIWHLPLSHVAGYLSQCTGSDRCFHRFNPDFPEHPPARRASEELLERPVRPRSR